MKFENSYVYNFQGALKGMRNPKESWDKSDSYFGFLNEGDTKIVQEIADLWTKFELQKMILNTKVKNAEIKEKYINKLNNCSTLRVDSNSGIREVAYIGPNDMKLAQTLIKAGPEHRKFMRQIFVSVDITAPLYWWKEMDTYKISTVSNSTSTMHKISSKSISASCFEMGDYVQGLYYASPEDNPDCCCRNISSVSSLSNSVIGHLEKIRQKFVQTKDIRYWKELIRWLPESWLQTRTWTANYEVLHSIVLQRGYHKLKQEWDKGFVHWCTTLPYAEDLIFLGEEREKVYNLYTN